MLALFDHLVHEFPGLFDGLSVNDNLWQGWTQAGGGITRSRTARVGRGAVDGALDLGDDAGHGSTAVWRVSRVGVAPQPSGRREHSWVLAHSEPIHVTATRSSWAFRSLAFYLLSLKLTLLLLSHNRKCDKDPKRLNSKGFLLDKAGLKPEHHLAGRWKHVSSMNRVTVWWQIRVTECLSTWCPWGWRKLVSIAILIEIIFKPYFKQAFLSHEKEYKQIMRLFEKMNKVTFRVVGNADPLKFLNGSACEIKALVGRSCSADPASLSCPPRRCHTGHI